MPDHIIGYTLVRLTVYCYRKCEMAQLRAAFYHFSRNAWSDIPGHIPPMPHSTLRSHRMTALARGRAPSTTFHREHDPITAPCAFRPVVPTGICDRYWSRDSRPSCSGELSSQQLRLGGALENRVDDKLGAR